MKNNFIIYCDLDGVIVGFHDVILSLINNPKHQKTKEAKKIIKIIKRKQFFHVDLNFDTAPQELIDFVRLFTVNNKTFWSILPWTKDGKDLWDFLQQSNNKLFILSSPVDKECEKGKIVWLLHNLNLPLKEKYDFILNNTIFEKRKYIYANPNSILIDDSEENIKLWNQQGGIGILHVNAYQTIKELKSILI